MKNLILIILIFLTSCYSTKPYYIVSFISYDKDIRDDYYVGTKLGKPKIVILDTMNKYQVRDTIWRNKK